MKALEINQLGKHFGQKQVLGAVSITVEPGEIFGYLGPNGAGKTTTIRCVLDFIRPSSGDVKIFGHNTRVDGWHARSKLSYLSSENNLYPNYTGQQHIDYLCSMRPIEQARLQALSQTLDFDSSVKVRHLSTGNRQKLGIILALIPQSKLLILDEPTRGLDPLLQNVFHSMLIDYKKAGGTVFMSSHNLAEVEEVCDRVAVIRAGNVVSNETIETLKQKSQYHVRIVFAKSQPTSVFRALSTTALHNHGRVAHFNMQGQADALIKLLAKLPVEDLELNRSSLEEMFVEMYQ